MWKSGLTGRTVLLSGAVSETIGASGFTALAIAARLGLVSANRFQLNTTSSTSSTLPLTGGRF